MSTTSSVAVGLDAAIVAVPEDQPRVLTVRRTSHALAGVRDGGEASEAEARALPFGPLDPVADRTLDLGLRRWVREQTGLELGYVEQLYTFGDRDRGLGLGRESRRVLSVGYLALIREERPAGQDGAAWRECYGFFPWEDWRQGRPGVIDRAILPGLEAWAEDSDDLATRRRRRERADIVFGAGGAPWNGERVLERYELLYEAGLVYEARRDRGSARSTDGGELGQAMALDHRRILATALGRLRGKILYRPVVFELLAREFTLYRLQRVVEALAGVGLHKQNFRRLVERAGLVEGTGRLETQTGGRPAELFRFRREVLRERPAPGVGLPGIKS